jgi:hypothetical protein
LLTPNYLAWNNAIADTIYNDSNAGVPVYLDLDDEKFAQICAHPALVGLDQTKEGLAASVIESINWEGSRSEMLWPIAGRSQRWMREFTAGKNPAGAPPMIAFLAVAVFAAEAMGEGDFGPLNYYSQLETLLGVTPGSQKAQRLQEAYKLEVLTMWALLKKWLVELEWSYGIPTAEALSHPYVSVAMSQALVRDADRKKLSRMFDIMNFRPGEQISPSDMSEFVNIWLQQPDCAANASFKTLWSQKTARERISEIVSKELEAWEGSVSSEGAGVNRVETQKKLRLVLKEKKYMGQKELQITLAINSNGEIGESVGVYRIGTDSELDFDFVQEGKNYALLANASQLSFESALLGDLNFTEKEGTASFRRLPTNLVVLEFNEDLQKYVEVTKAPLSRSLMLLVREDINLLAGLDALLRRNARPGFKDISTGLRGLPAGWRLISDVQLEASEVVTAPDPYEALKPTVTSQLSLNGGVSIPGPMSGKKFLSGYAPEVRATSQSETSISLTVFVSKFVGEKLEDVEIEKWESENGSLAVDLSEVLTEDGDYRVVFKEKNKATFQRDIFMRSGSKPDSLALRSKPTLVHSFELQQSEAAFGCIEFDNEIETYITGGLANYEYPESEANTDAGVGVGAWSGETTDLKFDGPRQKVQVDVFPPDSCVFTGAHRRELEMCTPTTKFVRGVCSTCGVVSTEYCTNFRATRRELYQKISESRVASQLNPVIQHEVKATDLSAAVSLVYSAVHGKVRQLLKGLEILSGEQMTAMQLLELLEQLGHIEFTRGISGYPEYWSIPDHQVIVREETDRHQLIGPWDEEALAEVTGLGLRIQANSVFGNDILTNDMSGDFVAELENIGVSIGSAISLAKAIPEFSFVRDTLDRRPLDSFEEIEVFDFDSGRWIKSDALKPGAIRLLTVFGMRNYYASAEDLEAHKAVSGSTTIVKYLAANALGISLLTVSDEDQTVTVPRGALVPGLYGRALVIGSGEPPAAITKQIGDSKVNLMQYKNVDLEVAHKIARLLAE